MVTTVVQSEVPAAVRAQPRISWGAIFAGALVSLAVWALLLAIGLAAGLSTVDPGETASGWRAAGIGTGIWGLVAPLIALFVGGLIAARESGVAKRSDGAIHGPARADLGDRQAPSLNSEEGVVLTREAHRRDGATGARLTSHCEVKTAPLGTSGRAAPTTSEIAALSPP